MAAGTLRSFKGSSMLSGLEKLQRPTFVQEPPPPPPPITQASAHISICTDATAASEVEEEEEEEEKEEEGPTTIAERGGAAVWLCVQRTTHGGTMDNKAGDDALAPPGLLHTDVKTQDLPNTRTSIQIDDGYSEAAADKKFVPFTIR
jgi:hypothetical protein